MDQKAAPFTADSLPYAGFTWKAAFPLLAPQLPSALLGAEAREELARFAKGLPGLWHWGMLETRLGENAPPPDLLAAMAQTPQTREQIRQLFAAGGHEALDPVSGPMTRWADDNGSLFSDSPNFWLEWDRDGADKPALPWLCLAPDFFSRTQGPLATVQLGEIANQFMDSAPDLQVSGAADCLVRIAEALPPGGKLMGFASLRPRGKKICRTFAKLPRGSMMTFLDAIGWPGARDRLPGTLPLFSLDGEDEWCQLEFDEKVGPYLALELAQTERGFSHKPTREQWLHAAVSRGWATEADSQAVIDWHGQTRCSLPDEDSVRLLRSFHLKLVLPHEALPFAKAYLGFYFRRRRQSLAA